MTFLPDSSNGPLEQGAPEFERLTDQIASHQYQRWALRNDRVQLQVMHSYALHPLETIEIPFTSWHLDFRYVDSLVPQWKQCVFVIAVLPRDRVAIGQERIAIDGVLLFGSWLDFSGDEDVVQVTLQLEPTELNESRTVDAFGRCFLYVDAIVHSSVNQIKGSLFPAACRDCRNFHGQTYGGNPLCCAIHPNGKDHCEDFESYHPNRRT